ncbi:MAG TPA: hypothetical protein VI911_08050 [Patescibacteria group bacterium]|nr:hypothetical protein [Patescibacteria group bacterium]
MTTIILTNTTTEDIELDVRGFNIPASSTTTITDYLTDREVAQSEVLVAKVAVGDIAVSNGVTTFPTTEGIKYCLGEFSNVSIVDEYRDLSGKLRVHQTSRKLGTAIYWTGEGDDTTNPRLVGGGTPIVVNHIVGDPDPDPIYVDFNIVENETWLHEGYITWKDALLDTITLEVVPRVTTTTVGTNTNYNLYGGYLIVPAAGNGTVAITSDITTHTGGLVYVPDDDQHNAPVAFWDATWNTVTKRYENITPAPYGNGRYNMFTVEVTLARFINKVPLLSNGFIALNSSDTDQVGSGMRLKVTADTNMAISGDHNWSMASILCMHRARSI